LQYRIGKYSSQDADIYLNPILENSNWFEFWRSEEFVKEGVRACRAILPDLQELFSEKETF